ncbi:hypothetical protein M0208_03940 [Sphingomonas sp. SUN019]|uniref:hypothetical protein n=1 Tax=Sphingomonas sp. SUN019 TaxID=2937788 RepID=UPI002164B662|nr:hypothetical protein [Sphingomonas sp. SUN019]UVO49702.1 hypothetical protein M0208_03940 [Sphingomonas sp. SUN019]
MATDFSQAAGSLSRTTSSLARRWATQRLSAVQSYGRILADYGNGRASGRAAAQAYAKLAMEEAARYPADAFQLATDYVSAVARAAGLSTAVDKETRSSPVIDIEMSGPSGGVASRDFVLENPHDSAADIAFTASNFLDDERDVKAKPVFAPAKFSIAACGEQTVTVSAKLDPRKFKPGVSYRSNVAVEGFDDMIVRVHLIVTPAN